MSQASIRGQIRQAVRERGDELRTLVQDLVGIPSVNTPPTGSERAAQEFLYQRARSLGLEATLYELKDVPDLQEHPAFRPGREYADRPNLVVRRPGRGGGRSLLFSGHVDVVPADENDWSDPPFSGEYRDGRIYGRGSWDMKAGLACGLMVLEVLDQLGIELKGDVGFESVVDEEFAGVNGTVAGRARGDHYDAAIILEPTNLRIYHATRGLRVADVTITGRAGVSFAGERLVNPVDMIGSLVQWFNEFGRERNQECHGLDAYKAYAVYDTPVPFMITQVHAGEAGIGKVLAVPQKASLQFFWETLPGEAREQVDQDFLSGLGQWQASQPYLSRESLSVTFPYRWMPGSWVPQTHPVVQTLRSAVRDVCGSEPLICGAPFPCDAYVFNLYSPTTAILFGPRGGNAHGVNEFVVVEDLVTVVESLCLMAVEWCGL